MDPRKYLITLHGKNGPQLYLPVKWRLVMLRHLYPEAQLTTEVLSYDPDPKTGHAAVRCRIELPNGAVGVGTKQESALHFPDFLEKAECVPTDVQILTPTGFRHHDDVSVGDIVASYDIVTDRCVWTRLLDKVFYRSAITVAIDGPYSFVVTPLHRWVTVNTRYHRRFKETIRLAPGERFLLGAPGPEAYGDVLPFSEEDAYLLGYLAATADERIPWRIGQPKYPRLYRRMSAKWSDDPRAWTTSKYEELAHAAQMRVPEDILHVPARLSIAAREAMFRGVQEARFLPTENRVHISAHYSLILDLIQVLAPLCGLPLRPATTDGALFRQRVRYRRHSRIKDHVIVPYQRLDVWCPQVAYGTWISRWPNGQVVITGNTGAIGRACAAVGIGPQYSIEYDYEAEAAVRKRGARSSYPGVDSGFTKEELQGGSNER